MGIAETSANRLAFSKIYPVSHSKTQPL